MFIKPFISICCCALLFGCITLPQSPLNKQHFKETVTVNEFAAEKVIIFSTIYGSQQQPGNQPVIGDDNFLRGFLDRQNGKTIFQVYNVIYYAQPGSQFDWKQFKQARYQTRIGQELVATKIIKQQTDCSALSLYGQCLYSEHVVFELDNNQVRELAKSYSDQTTPDSVWSYELLSTAGASYLDKLLLAEIAGLVAKMDEYVISQSTQPTLGARTSRLLELLSSPESLIIPPRAAVILPLLNK